MAQLRPGMHETLDTFPGAHKLGSMAHSCNPNFQEVGTRVMSIIKCIFNLRLPWALWDRRVGGDKRRNRQLFQAEKIRATDASMDVVSSSS